MPKFTTDFLPDCPCVKCVCLAMCRLKDFDSLYLSCAIVLDYLTPLYEVSKIHRLKRKVALKLALNPVCWDLSSQGFTVDR